jgi:hypothetical protein
MHTVDDFSCPVFLDIAQTAIQCSHFNAMIAEMGVLKNNIHTKLDTC